MRQSGGLSHRVNANAYGEVRITTRAARPALVASRPEVSSSKRYDKTTKRNSIHFTTPTRKADRGLCVHKVGLCVVRKD